ncbi:hypothetical protein NDU88_007628 [Pleurodeles waltl]|uniref:Uncharacterized protein n=1 Tax=Pleurodeles waltl TaxID=8319 RepID=A0AAV7STB3_PLEWA|nr:hypothetical protein NDU88_007628 [Pleurodeles waltl]
MFTFNEGESEHLLKWPSNSRGLARKPSKQLGLCSNRQAELMLSIILKRFKTFAGVRDTRFRPGSVVTETDAVFSNSPSPAPSNEDVVNAVGNSIISNNNMLGSTPVNVDNITSDGLTLQLPWAQDAANVATVHGSGAHAHHLLEQTVYIRL